MGYTILVAEDDRDIVELIELYLENDGYRVLTAADGVSALELVRREQIDLAVLDIMMPRMNGYELTKAIRAQSNFPIIILSAKNADSDPLEIIARVKSNLRRFYELNPGTTAPGSGTRLSVGGLELDPASFSLTKDGVPVALTPMEYKIMACLMKAPGRIFTKVQLYEAANGAYFESDENTMMVHISKLRDKVENDPKNPRYIKTVRGLGYKIENTQ